MITLHLTLILTLTPTLTLTLSELNAIQWRPVNYNLATAFVALKEKALCDGA